MSRALQASVLVAVLALSFLAPAPALGQGEALDPETLAAERERPTRVITMYGHIFGFGMNSTASSSREGEFGPDGPQPANTIYPTGDENLGLGAFHWCAPGQDTSGFGTDCDTAPINKLALFLTAGPVQTHQREDFVYSKLHNERGRTKDVVLDTTQDIKAWLWMSLDPVHAWSVGNDRDATFCPVGMPPDAGCPYPYWGWDPGVVPGFVVEAKLYTVLLGEYGQGASEPPPIFEAWRSGTMALVAEGATPPKEYTNGLPGQPNVHEFEINLGKPKVEVIPRTHDLVLVYSFYSILNGQKVSGHWWRIWAGELFPVRFQLPVKNPLDVELVIPQFIHDKLLIHGVMASAWGSYDVDVASARLSVFDDANRPAVPERVTRVGDFQVAHGAHFKPVNITWIWDYKGDGLRPGTYKVLVEVCNVQGSACEATEAAFTIDERLEPAGVVVGRKGQRTVSEAQLEEITAGQGERQRPEPAAQRPARTAGPEEPRATPGPEAALLAAGIAAVALAARRRRG